MNHGATVCVRVFLHRGRIINEECLAGARIINHIAVDALCLVTERKMKVWISVIRQIWPEAALQSSIAHIHPMQEVPPCLSLLRMEAGRIIYQEDDLALMESVYYLCIPVIIPSAVMRSTWRGLQPVVAWPVSRL